MTERVKEKLNNLRLEADNAISRAEAAEAKVRLLEQELLVKEQEISSLHSKLETAEEQSERAEVKLNEFKSSQIVGGSNEGPLVHKVQILEEELDAAEKNLKETIDKLRQMELKAGPHSEPGEDKDEWKKKYNDLWDKYQLARKDLDELAAKE